MTPGAHDQLVRLMPGGGRVVLDVGCGDGGLVRMLAARGARAIGLEVAAEPLARARAAPPVAGERYAWGRAQALPFADGTMDVVTFSNSLHHVVARHLDQAIAEAARVLRPGGLLCVQEPLSEGSYFELLRLVDDESECRALARGAIRRADGLALFYQREIRFELELRFASFQVFLDRAILVDGARAAALRRNRHAVLSEFTSARDPNGVGYRFSQPMRIDVLRRDRGHAGGTGA